VAVADIVLSSSSFFISAGFTPVADFFTDRGECPAGTLGMMMVFVAVSVAIDRGMCMGWVSEKRPVSFYGTLPHSDSLCIAHSDSLWYSVQKKLTVKKPQWNGRPKD
jgi:hypothetical protein